MSGPTEKSTEGGDSTDSVDKSYNSGSLEKNAYRASVFVEQNDLPPIWGKESQPGYKGRRVLGMDANDEKGPFANTGPLGAYETSYDDVESRPSGVSLPPHVYEIPARYGGKGVGYSDDYVVPLASAHEDWKDYSRSDKVCGIGRMAFWIGFGVICVLIVCAAVGGVIAGVLTSQKAAEKAAAASSASAAVAVSTGYLTLTSLSSYTRTSTRADGSEFLTTEVSVYLSTSIMMPGVVTNSHNSTVPLTSGSISAKSTVSASITSSSISSISTSISTTALTTATNSEISTTDSTKSAPSSMPSGGIFPSDCPAGSNSSTSATGCK